MGEETQLSVLMRVNPSKIFIIYLHMLKSHHSFLKLDRFCIEKNIRIQIKKLRRILRPGHEQCFVSVCVLYRYECSIFLYLARILKKYNTGNLYLFWWKSFGIFFGFFSFVFLFYLWDLVPFFPIRICSGFRSAHKIRIRIKNCGKMPKCCWRWFTFYGG